MLGNEGKDLKKKKEKRKKLVWTCLPGMCFDQGTTKGVILTAITEDNFISPCGEDFILVLM